MPLHYAITRAPWPLPALLVWAGAWLLFAGLAALGLAPLWALGLASLAGVVASLLGPTWWRRLMIGGGFPLSLALSGLASVPGWAWLLPLSLLMLVYPLNAWRDAPLFPTPPDALQRLSHFAPLPAGARVLDAGCGVGHGLRALRRAYPLADLQGLEWSWPLRAVCALWCPWARVRQGDIWAHSWSDYALVYLFQRPESMPRAVAKARAELAPGAWLVSLEFEAQALQAHARYPAPGGKMVWIYQMPLPSATTATDRPPGEKP
ncbi:MAG: methyltransferase type 12 [Burkholderiales bacterium PBB4]|nr:MAG: methyltransferase type 12 [Burkholderiales bacterium PBB4]